MTRILIIEASPRGSDSASRAVTETLVARLVALHPGATLIRHDIAAEPMPHLDDITLRAVSTNAPAEAERLKVAATLSDALTDELLACELLVVATPMWNFGIPSSLKAWIDLVIRPGRTFRYAEAGVEGLAKGKKAILVLASGGIFSTGPWQPFDFVEPYLRHVLGFIGISDVQVVRAEGMNLAEFAPDAVRKADLAVEMLAL